MSGARHVWKKAPVRLSLRLCGAVALVLLAVELASFWQLERGRYRALVEREAVRLESVARALAGAEDARLRSFLEQAGTHGVTALRRTGEPGASVSVEPSAVVVRAHGLELEASLDGVRAEVRDLRWRLALAGLLQVLGACAAAGVFVLRNRTIRAAEHVDVYARQLEERNDDLFEAKRIAEQADRAKTEFLANVSHELRTPLTAILGFADMLVERARDGSSSSEELEHARTIQRNGQYLYRLLAGLLDYSNLEAGRLRIAWMPCSPQEILQDVEVVSRAEAEAKRLRLRVEVEEGVPETVTSDPMRIRQILLALVENAIKFTSDGSVTLRLSTLSEGYTAPQLGFDVIDTGVGMTPSQLANLFEAFTPGDGSSAREHGGLGMGLALSRRLAELLGGEITVVSTPLEGSAFRLTVPVEAPTQGSDAAAAEAHEPGAPAVLDAHVLVAEDSPDSRRLLELVLEGAGADVTLVDNGAEAATLALQAWRDEEPYDVILMDAQMPGTDGVRATRALRMQGYPGTIVALTADAGSENREACLRAGCDEFLEKPIERERLLAVVRSLVKRAS